VWHNLPVLAASLLVVLLGTPAPERYAILAGRAPGDDPTEALEAAPQLARALGALGHEAAAGPAAWSLLEGVAVGELREVGGDPPPGIDGALDEGWRAFGLGHYNASLKLAKDAVAQLECAPRSVGVEARERTAHALWGLALAANGLLAAARPHLRWTLTRDPNFALERNRVPTAQRKLIDEVRGEVFGVRRASLAVTGTVDGSIYVDGLLSGQPPLTVNGLVPHDAWVWLERGGLRSLAHRVSLDAGAGTTLIPIDLDVEAALSKGRAGQPIVTALPGDPETPRLLQRLAGSPDPPVLAVLSRCAGAGCWQLEAVAGGQSITLHREAGAAGRLSFEELARDLAAEVAAGAKPVGEEAESSPTAPVTAPVAAPAPATAPPVAVEAGKGGVKAPRAWPWIVAAAAVAAVGTGVALYFALQSPGAQDVTVHFSAGSP
jgi:hypothetical protein